MHALLVAGLVGFAFLCGAIPFSPWIGRRFLRVDLRREGDGNPGAWNVGRAGGAGWFLLAVVLDAGKGWLPVWLARQPLGVRGWDLLPIALAPLLGHVFSPFLRGRGGKGLATALGVWLGLSMFRVPLVVVPSLWLASRVVRPPGWAVLVACGALCAALLLAWPRPLWIAAAAGTVAILAWTHRRDLAVRPSLGRHRSPA